MRVCVFFLSVKFATSTLALLAGEKPDRQPKENNTVQQTRGQENKMKENQNHNRTERYEDKQTGTAIS